ncbi:MAG: hypothetical protein KF861_23155, partial [Planctomycetaceae bacterium]|nr:hypothetical protein [Planctomycetaceae bacterium]
NVGSAKNQPDEVSYPQAAPSPESQRGLRLELLADASRDWPAKDSIESPQPLRGGSTISRLRSSSIEVPIGSRKSSPDSVNSPLARVRSADRPQRSSIRRGRSPDTT